MVVTDLDPSAIPVDVMREVHVVILDDIRVADGSTFAALEDAWPGVGVLVLAHQPTRAYCLRILSLGARACISKDAAVAEILTAVHLTSDGEHLLVSADTLAGVHPQRAGLLSLTARERAVLHVVSSVEISPQGNVGPVRPVERVPSLPGGEAPDYTWQEAISNAGSALVATTSGVPTEPIWLHPAGARCPSFGRKIAVGHGEILGMIAGHKGTFHIAWDNAKSELEITSARVACSAR